MALSLTDAAVAGLLAEAVLCGVFLILFGIAIHVLLRRKQSGRRIALFFFTSLTLFCCIWAHFIVDILQLSGAFRSRTALLGLSASDTYLLDDNATVYTGPKNLFLALSVAIADGLFAYRVWTVWNDWRIRGIPFLFLVATITCAVLDQLQDSKLMPGQEFDGRLEAFVIATYGCNAMNNLICTFLIYYKIRSVGRLDANRDTAHRVKSSAIVLAESGSLAAASSITILVLFAIESNAQSTLADMLPPLYGISFLLIIVRIGLQIAPGVEARNNNLSSIAFRSVPVQSQTQPTASIIARNTVATVERRDARPTV